VFPWVVSRCFFREVGALFNVDSLPGVFKVLFDCKCYKKSGYNKHFLQFLQCVIYAALQSHVLTGGFI